MKEEKFTRGQFYELLWSEVKPGKYFNINQVGVIIEKFGLPATIS